MKILYAASNNHNAKIQLARFMRAVEGKPFQVKVAAYKKSSPKGLSIDWTLDCLLNVFRPDHLSLENDNLDIYYEQVKSYSPDLVISDLDYFSSYIANSLDVTLWQCSSSLLNYAVQNKYNVGLFKAYSYLLKKNDAARTQRIINILDNSDLNLVYSHFGDAANPPDLKDNFEWVRPYYSVGKVSVPCQHNIVAGMLDSNKKILSILKKQPDSVAFTECFHEKHAGLWVKDIGNAEEYFCNLKNSNLFVCEGQTSFLADAFYNNKYSVTVTNFKDVECVTNSMFSEHLRLSSSVYDQNLEPFLGREIETGDNGIKLLHQRIEEL